MKLQKRMMHLDTKSPNVCEYIAEKLNRFCEYLNNEYSINSGGCCWIAYCIAKLLEKSGFDYTIEVCSYLDLGDFATLQELPESLAHYFISIQDSEGGFYDINRSDFSDDKTIWDVTSEDILEHYKSGEWCCSYNHLKNKTIQSLLRTFYIDMLYDVSEELGIC